MPDDTEEDGRWSPPKLPEHVRQMMFEELRASARAAFEVSAGYGKWLVASLLAVNGGALVGLFSFLDERASEKELIAGYAWAAWAFVAGMVLAIILGFFAWVNWSLQEDEYKNISPYTLLYDDDAWLGETEHQWGISFTYWGSIVAGALSTCCILIGAYLMTASITSN